MQKIGRCPDRIPRCKAPGKNEATKRAVHLKLRKGALVSSSVDLQRVGRILFVQLHPLNWSFARATLFKHGLPVKLDLNLP